MNSCPYTFSELFSPLQATVYVLHWVKGAPFWQPEGRHDHLTFWEQIDHGAQNTTKKKLFTIVPVILCILACIECDWNAEWIFVNGIAAFCALLGKFPFMHRTRIFGINKD